MQPIDPFENVNQAQIDTPTSQFLTANGNLVNIGTIQAGNQTTSLHYDSRGLWLGNNSFANAPFRVDNQGNVTATAASLINAIINGTITVGGSGNSDGIITVKDSSGNQAVLLNNAGIEIDNGKLVIKNSSSTTIMDATGLVSTNNFLFGSATETTLQQTTSGSYVNISNCSVTFTLPRTVNVLVLFEVLGFNGNISSTGATVNETINVDGVDQSKYTQTPGSGTSGLGTTNTSGHASWLLQLAAGTHTITGRFAANGGGTANINFATLVYIILGS